MKRTFLLTQLCLVLLVPFVVSAVETIPPESFASAHPDIIVYVFGLVFAGFFFLLWRLISKNDEEHKEILTIYKEDSEKKWKALDSLSSKVNHLQGEHDVMKGVYLSRRIDDRRPED